MAFETVELNSGSGGAKLVVEEFTEASVLKSMPASLIVFGPDGGPFTRVDVLAGLPVAFNTVKDGSGTELRPLVDADGHLQIDVLSAASTAVTNAGTFATQVDGAALTSLQLIDNIVSTVDAVAGAAPVGVPPLAVRDDALSALTPAEGDFVPLRTDANGALWTKISGTITVGSHAVTNAGTFAVQVDGDALTSLQLLDNIVLTEDAAHQSGDPGVQVLAVRQDAAGALAGTDGDYIPLIVDSSGRLHVTVGNTVTVASHAVTNAGTFAVQVSSALPAGTNAIGKLAANSGVDIGDVDVTSQPARDRLTDNVGVALQTDALLSDTTALTPKFAIIDAATSGDNTLVAAVADKKIRVLALMMVAAGTVNARFESGAAGTALSGQMNLVANSGFTLPFNPVGWCETAASTLLNLELSGAISVDGLLTYVEV